MLFKYKLMLLISIIIIFAGNVNAELPSSHTYATDIIKTELIQETYNIEFKREFNEAISKFENLNIKISYNDFRKLIDKYKENDFYIMLLANKTTELGFFDLSNIAFSKFKDVEITKLNVENTKKYYFPSQNIEKNDILILAELYSNIVYNDQAKESIDELQNTSKLLQSYDYANYIMALAYYKLNDNSSANLYIKKAIKLNKDNINYKILEAKILSQNKNNKYSKKIIKELNSINELKIISMQNKINSSEEYINYLCAKKDFDKNYYLGKYYYTEHEYNKSIKVLQNALSKNKKNNAILYGLISRCYYNLNDFNHAEEFAKKSRKIKPNNEDSLITLGDLEFKNGNYKNSIKYYKEILNNKSTRQEILEKIANSYSKISNNSSLYNKLIKEYPNSYIANYQVGVDTTSIGNIKKAIAINILFQDAWIDLARIMIEQGNLDLAENYLTVANYIDNSNYRYYYYQNLLKKKELKLN